MSRIYLASSWRNPRQPEVLAQLRAAGHEVYDFRNPRPGDKGFGWSGIDPLWRDWTPATFRAALEHDLAKSGFKNDFDGMTWANEFCLLLPCGKSAHLEAGWAIGQGKRTSIYLPEQTEPELMYLTGGERTRICVTMAEVLAFHAPAPALVSTGCGYCDRGHFEMFGPGRGQHVFRARGGAVTGQASCTRKEQP